MARGGRGNKNNPTKAEDNLYHQICTWLGPGNSGSGPGTQAGIITPGTFPGNPPFVSHFDIYHSLACLLPCLSATSGFSVFSLFCQDFSDFQAVFG